MLDGLPLDPYTVLGVARDATAEQVREAYRQKSKKYHPDAGGDEWAFRIVVRAYEMISGGGAARSAVPPTNSGAPDDGRIRPGVVDRGVDPTRLVHVEMLWRRYEVGDVVSLLTQRHAADDRALSGSLTITWPAPDLADRAESLPAADRIILALNAAFDKARARPEVTAARAAVVRGRFEAQIGYPSGGAAWNAFRHLHVDLRARGLGVKQWTRDLAVPRG